MGIRALNLTSLTPFVSEYDEGYNATVTNQLDIDDWNKSKAKDKGLRPEPVYAHSPDATVWQIGTLSSMLMKDLSDDLASVGEGGSLTLRNADNDVLAARLGLRGWSNFTDESGVALAFATEQVPFRGRRVEMLTEELTAMIPIPILREIGRKVKAANSLTAVQAKNSDSAS